MNEIVLSVTSGAVTTDLSIPETNPFLGVTSHTLAGKLAQKLKINHWDRIVELLALRGYSHEDFSLPGIPRSSIGTYRDDQEYQRVGSGKQHTCFFDSKLNQIHKYANRTPIFMAPLPTEEQVRGENGELYSVKISDLDRLVRFFEKALSIRTIANAFGLTHCNPRITKHGLYIEDPLPFSAPYEERLLSRNWRQKHIMCYSDFIDFLERFDGEIKFDSRFFTIDSNQYDTAYNLKASKNPQSYRHIIIIDGVEIHTCPDSEAQSPEDLKFILDQNSKLSQISQSELDVLLDYFDKESSD